MGLSTGNFVGWIKLNPNTKITNEEKLIVNLLKEKYEKNENIKIEINEDYNAVLVKNEKYGKRHVLHETWIFKNSSSWYSDFINSESCNSKYDWFDKDDKINFVEYLIKILEKIENEKEA